MGEIPEDMKLLAQLMGASHAMTTSTMDSLIHNLSYGDRLKQAALSLIRRNVRELFDGPHLPNPDYVIAALHPSAQAIEEWLTDHYEDWHDPACAQHRHFDSTCCD